jgi:hypothetical protein
MVFQERCVCVCADEIYTYPRIAPGAGASVGLADGVHCVQSGGARAPVREPRGCIDAKLADIKMSHGHLREDCEAGRDVRAYEDADGCMFLGRGGRAGVCGDVCSIALHAERGWVVCADRGPCVRVADVADVIMVFQSKGGQRRAVRVC